MGGRGASRQPSLSMLSTQKFWLKTCSEHWQLAVGAPPTHISRFPKTSSLTSLTFLSTIAYTRFFFSLFSSQFFYEPTWYSGPSLI